MTQNFEKVPYFFAKKIESRAESGLSLTHASMFGEHSRTTGSGSGFFVASTGSAAKPTASYFFSKALRKKSF